MKGIEAFADYPQPAQIEDTLESGFHRALRSAMTKADTHAQISNEDCQDDQAKCESGKHGEDP